MTSTKPTIFFSHSSQDSQQLAQLKSLFVDKTGSSIDVFLSSDGQSIPLGRNWVHQIEEALHRASLMVVFVSPASIRSSWLFFESGFAYSKGKRVIPVGFRGVDLITLSPPLSLLQGFNITSEAGLNNIIALTNEEFGHSHAETFTADEFSQVCGDRDLYSAATFGDYVNAVSYITINVQRNGLVCPPEESIDRIVSILESQNIEHEVTRDTLNIFGVSFSHNARTPLYVTIDPYAADNTFPIVEDAIQAVRTNGVKGLHILISFVEGVSCLQGRYRITGRMYGAGIKLAADNWLLYRDLKFKIERSQHPGTQGRATIALELLSDEIPIDQIRELVTHLFEREILLQELA